MSKIVRRYVESPRARWRRSHAIPPRKTASCSIHGTVFVQDVVTDKWVCSSCMEWAPEDDDLLLDDDDLASPKERLTW